MRSIEVLSLAVKGPKGEVSYLRGWEIEKEKVKGKQNEKRKEELEKVKGW